VRAHLGSGGMGAVFAALDRVRQEEVAIKVLLPHLLADPKARERFLNEARIASSLSHPNIVRVFDVQQTTGLTFLTMERLKGRSLRQEITRRQQTAERFKPAEVLAIAEPLCGALHHAHGFTVHRDVKPENIWLGEDGTVKLMDFGIARLLRPSQFTSTGLALGTAYYMAPEQKRGQEVDHRADQFALAVVLYELLTGEIPQGVIRPPHMLRRSVPAAMSQAIMKALEARPEARHADVAAFGRALTSRPGSGLEMRAVVAGAVFLLLGAAISFPFWKLYVPGTSTMETAEPIPKETGAEARSHVRVEDPRRAITNLIEPIPKETGAEARSHVRVEDPRRAITNSIGMKLTLIPAGEFLMGSPDTDKDADDDEKPQHRVRITRPFYLGVHEVTRGQFRRFVDDSGYQTEAEKDGKGGLGWNEEAGNFEQNPRYTWLNPGFEQTDLHPVVNVSWNDAVAFAEWLGRKEGKIYRLPTEAEWEYACRAGTTTRYFCGDDPEGLAEVGNILDASFREKYPDSRSTIAARDGFVYTAPVGRYRPNAWGLHDMHGNVCEWCWDWYGKDFYKASRVDDPAGPLEAALRVGRGGCWTSIPRLCGSAYRIRDPPINRYSSLGFRLARVQSVR